jgi:hypothetical protein
MAYVEAISMKNQKKKRTEEENECMVVKFLFYMK